MEWIVKIICCSAVFIGFYHWVLQREKMFRFNRFYLVATLVLSVSIPFMELGLREFQPIEVDAYLVQSEISNVNFIAESSVQNTAPLLNKQSKVTSVNDSNNNFSASQILFGIGTLISLVLFIRFLYSLNKIRRLILKNERDSGGGFTLVKLNESTSPYSFFHFLFVCKDEVEKNEIRSEIFYHEYAHIKQKHSIDVLFVEFLLIFFWFNPFLYLYKKSIVTNHEFLADEEVLNNNFNTQDYQYLLLEKIPVKSQTQLSSSFNYLVTKKRLIMMTKKTSKLKTNALKFFSIPLLALVMFAFSEKVSAQMKPVGGVSKELLRTYKKQVRKASVVVKNEDGTKSKVLDTSKLDKELMNKIYDQMSDEQKMKVTPLPPEKEKRIMVLTDDDIELNLEDLDLDEIAKLGLDFGEFGLDIAGIFLDDIDHIQRHDFPRFQRKLFKIQKDGERIQKYFDSKEWEDKAKKIEKNAEALKDYFESPEWKKNMEEPQMNTQRFNNPEALKNRKEAFQYREKAFGYRDGAFKFRDKAFRFRDNAFKFRDKALALPMESPERKKWMKEYDLEMEKYDLEMGNYDREMEKYDTEMEKYDEKIKLYEQSIK